jgi:phenylalanine-4-hydroxylase
MTVQLLRDAYTDEDRQTWSTLFERCRDRLRRHACAQLTAGFESLRLSERIETLSVVNDRLHALSGWRMQPVTGLLPEPQFCELLRDRLFPTAPALRKPSELEFAELPDLFHDVVGHLPLLVNRDYGDFLQAFGSTALRYAADPAAMKAFARFYWFTAETGLVRENGELKILGGAVLTSAAESSNALRAEGNRLPLSVATACATDYNIFGIQREYFVAASFGELTGMLATLEDSVMSLRTTRA